jgi:hypothetical protein
MTRFVSEMARTGMTLAVLLLATGPGADNAVPDLRLTLDASADTIFASSRRFDFQIRAQICAGLAFSEEVQEISLRSLRSSRGFCENACPFKHSPTGGHGQFRTPEKVRIGI